MEMIIAKKQKEKSNPTYKINGVSIFLKITIDEYRFIFIENSWFDQWLFVNIPMLVAYYYYSTWTNLCPQENLYVLVIVGLCTLKYVASTITKTAIEICNQLVNLSEIEINYI